MQTEFFITSGGIAIGSSFPTWIAAHVALLKLVEDGAAELVIEKSPVQQPDPEPAPDFREVLEHPMNRGAHVRREWLDAR